ncbi:MAG: hypothetical protein KC553_13940 [Nitrospina sp.]|nr:hypothetical protein [Nitrospina sp.]
MKNNKSKFRNLVAVLAFVLLGSPVLAGEITYTPVNPNFGGSPFNGAPLLNSANAINDFEAPPRSARNSARDFAERLDRAILGQLSRQLAGDIIDDEGNFIVGTIETGVNTITVGENGTVVISGPEGETIIRVPQ